MFKVEVLSANFTPEDPGELIGGNRFKSVDQYLLPKVWSSWKSWKVYCSDCIKQFINTPFLKEDECIKR